MHASRLVRVAKDIFKEYADFQILGMLQEASNLSAQRSGLNDPQYIERARLLRSRAQSAIQSTKLNQYPRGIRELLEESAYMQALPERLANVVLHGFPDDKTQAISSSELQIYVQLANRAAAELSALISAASQFHLVDITIPEGNVGLDVTIPREVFDNRADEYTRILSAFVEVAAYFNELATGSAEPPRLIFTATTDPVVALGLWGVAAYGVLKLYKLILEVAEKQISLCQTLRSLREMPKGTIDPADLQGKIESIVEDQLSRAVTEAVASVQAKVEDSRVNEIENAIRKHAPTLCISIANGATISVTIESLDRLDLIVSGLPGAPGPQIKKELELQRRAELRIEERRKALDAETRDLLTVRRSGELGENENV
ncbi:MAG TPA: hypothetical protein VLV50_13405 [Stellaceae bacterium]|nr:hypothetical protein [Stellaceae bacterium]